MLKPITIEEKLDWTLRFQTEKAMNELFCDLIDQKYFGLVDIWANVKKEKGKIVLEIKMEKIKHSTDPMTNDKCARYLINPNKGVKLIKS
jgi:hypothetical protein